MKTPRSSLFAEAEKEAATVVKEPESREAELFLALAGQIAEKKIPLPGLSTSEEEMECFMRGEPVYSSRISHTERREEKKETKLREKEQPRANKETGIVRSFQQSSAVWCAL